MLGRTRDILPADVQCNSKAKMANMVRCDVASEWRQAVDCADDRRRVVHVRFPDEPPHIRLVWPWAKMKGSRGKERARWH